MVISPLEAHETSLRELSRSGQLAAYSPHATISNREWFKRGRPTSARQDLHEVILAEFFASAVPLEKRAIVLAGPPGAGKSSVLARVVAEMGSHRADWRVIDADHFKDVLLLQALRDGSYETHLLPPAVRALQERGEVFFPRELASLVHEESSQITKLALQQAIARGENLIVDTVLATPDKAVQLGRSLSDAGYTVTVVQVETSLEISTQRTLDRWRAGYQADLDRPRSPEQLGGRWVPSVIPQSLFADDRTGSSSLTAAHALAETCLAVLRAGFYEVSDVDASPVRVSASGRTSFGSVLVDADALAAAHRARADFPVAIRPVNRIPRVDRPGPDRDR